MRVVTVEGSPRQRGEALGRELRDEIGDFVSLWRRDIAKTITPDVDGFVRRFLERTDFLPAIKAHSPNALVEAEAMATAVGVDPALGFVVQLVDEYWVQGASMGVEHCSGVGVIGRDGVPTFIAQNMDVETYRDGFQTVVRHLPDDGPETLVVTNPGLLVMNGMNAQGVGACMNSLTPLEHSPRGLPVAFVVRGLLEKSSLVEAADFVGGVPHASGQNYLLGGRDGIRDLECSAKSVVEAPPEHGLVLHTNHPLANSDLTAQAAIRVNTPEDRPWSNSEVRLTSLQRHLTHRADSPPTVEAVQNALRAADDPRHPVCRSDRAAGGFTFASTVMVFGDVPEMHVSAGPPDTNPYERITMERDVLGAATVR